MLKYLTIPVTPFEQNCSLVWCDETQKAAVIDPGGDLDRVLAQVQKLGLSLEQIWLTHAHIDHAGATGQLARELGAGDGFRTIINTGRVGRQEVQHVHIHVVGGPDPLGPMILRPKH